MKPKRADHTWPSTSQTAVWQQLGATTWLFSYLENPAQTKSCNDAWLTNLVSAGDLVACNSQGRAFLVLASATHAFAGWEVEVRETSFCGDLPAFQVRKDFSLSFQHVCDSEDWVSVPYAPALAGEHGPVVLQQSAPARHLVCQRIAKGLCLTVEQCKELLKTYNVAFKGNASRATLHELVLDRFLESQDEKDAAMKKMKLLADSEEVESNAADDTDYEDLLDALDANEMQGDPDLKKEKERLKSRKRRKLYHTALDAKETEQKAKQQRAATKKQLHKVKGKVKLKVKRAMKAKKKAKPDGSAGVSSQVRAQDGSFRVMISIGDCFVDEFAKP